MKTYVLPMLAFLFSITAFAQSPNEKYVGYMKKNIELLDAAKSSSDLQTAANNFERIAMNEKTEWLPAYFGAYALIMKAYTLTDMKEVDPTCDKADELIAMAESIAPQNAEITTLKAMVLTARMRADGSRGMTMGPKATQYCHQALQQMPAGNPRAMMQMAQMLYYTPAAFGGGTEAGINMLKKSVDAFDSFVPASALHPNWGKAYTVNLLAQWTAKQ